MEPFDPRFWGHESSQGFGVKALVTGGFNLGQNDPREACRDLNHHRGAPPISGPPSSPGNFFNQKDVVGERGAIGTLRIGCGVQCSIVRASPMSLGGKALSFTDS